MADDIIINVGSDNEEIQIHPVETVNNINTEVSGDKYYTDLARSWAISDNLVANTDYSSKYYANISKNYAINAELSATNASNSAATAVLKADAANISASNAYIWAEGTDEEIIAIGGTHSSKGWVNYILNNAPTATTTRTATGAIITVSDIIHGETTSELFDGAKGDKGDKGDKGEKGDTGIKGDTGAPGADGFSPIATVEKVGNTATITITDKNGTTTTNIYDGVGAITDVTVNNISVLDDGVAKIDLTNYVNTSTLATTLADYVTNSTLTATLADYALLSDIPTVPTTDQTYDNTSSNPQSGTAVAEAIAGVNIPIATSTTVGTIKPDNSTTRVDANGTLSAISRNVGEIVQSTLPLTDAGLHLLDGTLINGGGIYAEFVDYIAELYADNPTANYFCTETEWQASVTQYGSCGKFVYDSTNNTVRLPKQTMAHGNLIYSYSNGANTVRVYKDGYCIQTGYMAIPASAWYPVNLIEPYANMDYDIQASEVGVTSSTFSNANSISRKINNSQFELSSYSSASAGLSWMTVGYIDTSRFNRSSIYEYIVIAASSKTDIQVDIDNIVTDLNGKADTDLTNVTNVGNIKIANASMPSSRVIQLTTGASGAAYIAPADGWLFATCDTAQSGWIIVSNGSFYSYETSTVGAAGGVCEWVPIRKGSTGHVNYYNASNVAVWFIYAVGSESEAQ